MTTTIYSHKHWSDKVGHAMRRFHWCDIAQWRRRLLQAMARIPKGQEALLIVKYWANSLMLSCLFLFHLNLYLGSLAYTWFGLELF